MAHLPRGNTIEVVWESVSDGGWHTLGELAMRLRIGTTTIATALDFLVKYGFAESTDLDQENFRLSCLGPSPKVTARILHCVGFGQSKSCVSQRCMAFE